MLALILLTAPAADPTAYVVVNRASPRFVVVNRVQSAPCAYCGTSCTCAAGVCPACPVAAKPAAGTLTTASGRVIRATVTGYAYADESPAAQAAESRPAHLPASVSCPNGNCSTGRPAAPSVLDPSRRFVFPKK